MLTEHYDRHRKKQLKGRIGIVRTWVCDDREDNDYKSNARYLRFTPEAPLVKFYERVKEKDINVQRYG